MSPVQPLRFNIVISKPHTLITWSIQDVLFDQIFLYFIEKIIKSFLAILKVIYSQLLDDLQQHLKKAMLKFKWGLKLIYLTHWRLTEIVRDPPLIPWRFLNIPERARALKLNYMRSNHSHKIRFQDDVYFKSDKWAAKLSKNKGQMSSNWSPKEI